MCYEFLTKILFPQVLFPDKIDDEIKFNNIFVCWILAIALVIYLEFFSRVDFNIGNCVLVFCLFFFNIWVVFVVTLFSIVGLLFDVLLVVMVPY